MSWARDSCRPMASSPAIWWYPAKSGKPDWDNGIRAHGSSEYLSMYSSEGYSHGCHRLPNHLAIRLYSFILRHRPMRILGDQPVNIARQFLLGDDVFEIRVPSRGYQYLLEPPLPIDVLEGEIKGTLKTPILTYVPKPGVRYPGPPPAVPNSAEGRAAGARAGRPAAKTKGDAMNLRARWFRRGGFAGVALLAILGLGAAVGLGAEDASKSPAVGEPSGAEDRRQGQHHPANGSATQGGGQVGQQDLGGDSRAPAAGGGTTTRQWTA